MPKKENAQNLPPFSYGYRPSKGKLDPKNPPRGGSGMPSKTPSTSPNTGKKG